MNLSVFFDHVLQAKEQTGKTVEELLEGVRNAGIEAVEINLSYLCEHEEVLGLLSQNDLKVSCIYEFYDMGNRDETEKARKHVDTAVSVGAKRILVVPGFLSGEASKQMQKAMPVQENIVGFFENNSEIKRMAEGLSFATKYGKEKGVVVTVEDFDGLDSPLAGMYGIHWFLQQVPELMYTLDTGNFLFYGEDVLDAFELLKERIAHVHCKDRQPENNASVQTGTGYIPFAEIINKLKVQQYDGFLAIEHFDVDGQEECMHGSAEFLGTVKKLKVY
ncbi:MAG: sugar phosphate isomerase/epimerase [Lachnospiraceae bacterium]|nr:sugar phosphate isomerase/epimerase [Lachnospiraceae bacterium]